MVNDNDKEKLMAFIHGELDATEARRISDLIDGDAEFRREFEELQAASRELESIFSASPREELSPEQLATIRAHAAPKKSKPLAKWIFLAVPLAVASIIAVVVVNLPEVTQVADAPDSLVAGAVSTENSDEMAKAPGTTEVAAAPESPVPSQGDHLAATDKVAAVDGDLSVSESQSPNRPAAPAEVAQAAAPQQVAVVAPSAQPQADSPAKPGEESKLAAKADPQIVASRSEGTVGYGAANAGGGGGVGGGSFSGQVAGLAKGKTLNGGIKTFAKKAQSAKREQVSAQVEAELDANDDGSLAAEPPTLADSIDAQAPVAPPTDTLSAVASNEQAKPGKVGGTVLAKAKSKDESSVGSGFHIALQMEEAAFAAMASPKSAQDFIVKRIDKNQSCLTSKVPVRMSGYLLLLSISATGAVDDLQLEPPQPTVSQCLKKRLEGAGDMLRPASGQAAQIKIRMKIQ